MISDPSAGKKPPLQFLLLGEEPLLLRCAETLLARGHGIQAVVSRSPAIQAWASQQGIELLDRTTYAQRVAEGKTDVLASITYPALIPAATLAQARVAAVNFHDGPLPRYAGMNGSAWALHNGEGQHAVVWHVIEAGLDEGDILERRGLMLDAHETSVSLNIKVAALAHQAFGDLLDRLETGTLTGTPQDRSVPRLMYSRHDRPAWLGALDWTLTARQLHSQVRACDFGPYANPFALSKLVHRGRAVVVQACEPAPGQGSAGRVLALDDTAVTVAAGSGTLRLLRFASLTGQPLTVRQAAACLSLEVGADLQLPALAPDAQAFAADSRAIARAEPKLLALLGSRRVPQLPVEWRQVEDAHEVPVPLTPEFSQRYASCLQDAVVAAFGVLLSSLLRDSSFDLTWVGNVQPSPDSLRSALFAQALPWRLEVPPAASFADWVAQVGAQRAGLQKSPGWLVDLVARHEVLRNQPDLQQLALSTVAVLEGDATRPQGAGLALVLRGEGVTLKTQGAVDAPTLHMLARRLAAVAQSAMRSETQAISALDALDDDERDQQLVTWNTTAREFPDRLRIHDLFEQQVVQRPDALALHCQGRSLSFAELDRAANRVARVLAQHGIGVGQYVGLVVERGIELVVAMLGVAKSGAAYVPIDTIYPDDRLSFMLEDSACTAVLASQALAGRCPHSLPVLLVDGPEVSVASSAPVACAAAATDVCYAIYTSGSTGKPKGVVLTHRAVVNTLDWVNREFGVGPGDVLLFVTSPSFDLSVYDIFGALGAGAAVDVASSELLADPQALARRLCHPDVAEGPAITIWDSAPPALARLANFLPERAGHSALRLVMLSGDWIPLGLPSQLMGVFPGVKVKSLGGATEAAIWSNYFHVDSVEPRWTSIPYGKPIQNARYDILDPQLRPLPVGIAGDLYIGGTCLAQGYLNRPELTAERFIADPHRPGERLYKTGDLARFWPDGTMEFLGRADFQVKIRGYRVELGEIEAALCKLPGIQAALCSAFQDASGQKSLLAYVQTPDPRGFPLASVKAALSAGLPDFMVPAHFVPLQNFPLSSNGKLDRRALPSPEQAARSQALRPPATALQAQMVEVWQTVLKRSPVGISDNFFDLGGHSLLAVELVKQMQRATGVAIPLASIVSHPSIEQLTQHLGLQDLPAAAGEPMAISPALEAVSDDVVTLGASAHRPLFIICHASGQATPYVALAQRLDNLFCTYGLMPKALPGVPLAHDSIEDMAQHCLRAMRSVQPHGPYRIGGLCAGGLIAFEMAVQLEADGQDVDLLLMDAFVPHLPMRPESTLQAQRRARMAQALQADAGSTGAWLRRASRAMHKVFGALVYEGQQHVLRSADRVKLALFKRVLAGKMAWPQALKPLELYSIFCEARDRYVPQTLTRTRVVIFKATQLRSGEARDKPLAEIYTDEAFGWRPYVQRGVTLVDVPGGHLTMLEPPYVDALARSIKEFVQYPPAPPPPPAQRPRSEPASAPAEVSSAVQFGQHEHQH